MDVMANTTRDVLHGHKSSVVAPTMESAINHLELLFLRIEADLSYVGRKLETEYASKYASISNEPLNPLTAISRIEAVRSELQNIKRRSTDLESQKATLTASIQKATVENCQALEDISGCGNFVFEEDDDDDMNCADFLPLPNTEPMVTSKPNSNRNDAPSKRRPGGGNSGIGGTRSGKGGGGSSGDLTARSNKFMPVSEEEFNSVSSLVRGRCKLSNVNAVYQAIHDSFRSSKGKKGTKPLTIKDMTDMGLKITGQSGEAKLKVLRQLKLITISNTDKSVALCTD
eukprot:m.373578 g.373578  ORF g.373578 m.373578 type:complete len:286 (+) comp20887_c0_seq3:207-1064(+)